MLEVTAFEGDDIIELGFDLDFVLVFALFTTFAALALALATANSVVSLHGIAALTTTNSAASLHNIATLTIGLKDANAVLKIAAENREG